VAERLPAMAEGLPAVAEGRPAVAERLPAMAERLQAEPNGGGSLCSFWSRSRPNGLRMDLQMPVSEPPAARRQPANWPWWERLAERLLCEAAQECMWNAVVGFRMSHQDREDVVQEALLQAYRQRWRYSADRGTPAQWCARIAQRMALTFIRARSAKKRG